MSVRDVIIVGAGPSGLAAAIAAKQHGLDYQVLEQGVLVNSIFRFTPQMVFFTTPELLEIGGTYDLQISGDEQVLSIAREGHDAEPGESVFALETQTGKGVRRVRHARFVVMAIGYYDHPVMIGVPGEDLPHVRHYYSEPHVHYRQRVVIVGGGNSAAESALEMFRAGAHVTLVHRAPTLKSTIKYWVRPDIENRIKEGSIAGRLGRCVKEIRPTSVVLVGTGGGEAGWAGSEEEEIPADAVYLLTGYRADADLMCRAGVMLNERQAPLHHPETFETNVPGLFVAGGAIAGVDTGTIFIENGRFHGTKIIEEIARRVES